MSFSKHKLILQAYRASDLSAFITAGLLAAWISGLYVNGVGLFELLSLRFSLINLAGYMILALCWLVIFQRLNLYAAMRSRTEMNEETVLVGWAAGIASFIYYIVGLIFDISLFTPVFILSFWVFSTAATLLYRRIMYAVLKKVHLGDHNDTRIMVVGGGAEAKKYAELVQLNEVMGFQFVGYISDEPMADGVPLDYLGKLDEFETVFKENVVDEIVITLPLHKFNKDLEKLVDHAAAHGVLVRLPMDQLFGRLFGKNVWRLRSEMVSHPGEQTSSDLVLSSGHQMGWEYLAKRAMDFTAASILLLLVSPLMLFAAVWIKASSKGDILFIQDRYGYNGRVIRLYKFRTMIQNADELQDALRKQNEREGAAFKIKDDPRVTRCGKFLRKTSIDELPQLLNVLKGEMSLVGPRPLPLADYKRFQEVTHMRRLSVLPGITCTWQAGGRDNVTFDEWMQLDMDYIDNWSLVTDIMILFKTVPAVLFGRGAS